MTKILNVFNKAMGKELNDVVANCTQGLVKWAAEDNLNHKPGFLVLDRIWDLSFCIWLWCQGLKLKTDLCR